jgi:hypothetical protein
MDATQAPLRWWKCTHPDGVVECVAAAFEDRVIAMRPDIIGPPELLESEQLEIGGQLWLLPAPMFSGFAFPFQTPTETPDAAPDGPG